MRQLKVQKLITYLEAKGGIKLYQQIDMVLTPTLLEELERTILGKKFLSDNEFIDFQKKCQKSCRGGKKPGDQLVGNFRSM